MDKFHIASSYKKYIGHVLFYNGEGDIRQNFQASWDRRGSSEATAFNLDEESLSSNFFSSVIAFQRTQRYRPWFLRSQQNRTNWFKQKRNVLQTLNSFWHLWENRKPGLEPWGTNKMLTLLRSTALTDTWHMWHQQHGGLDTPSEPPFCCFWKPPPHNGFFSAPVSPQDASQICD